MSRNVGQRSSHANDSELGVRASDEQMVEFAIFDKRPTFDSDKLRVDFVDCERRKDIMWDRYVSSWMRMETVLALRKGLFGCMGGRFRADLNINDNK